VERIIGQTDTNTVTAIRKIGEAKEVLSHDTLVSFCGTQRNRLKSELWKITRHTRPTRISTVGRREVVERSSSKTWSELTHRSGTRGVTECT
jgi:hypothetical protein